jgi:4-hydroxybenzoate polyprenyltransferase
MSLSMIGAMLRTMRPKQWVKNAVIYAALVFDRQLTDLNAILRTTAGFVIFCLLSGIVYIINDIIDVEADKIHPDKKKRPIASGDLPINAAWAAVVLLLLLVLPLSYLLSAWFFIVALVYFLLNLAYSKWLKHVPLIDVLSIAAFFVLRVAAGVMLVGVARFSPWLYVVTTLGALYIGFGKRRAELALLADEAQNHRRVLDGYTIPLLDQYITIVSATTIIAYSLYTFSAENLPDNHFMMLTIPFVIYGVFRYLYLIKIKQTGGSPEDVLFSDAPLLVTILLWGLMVISIFYLF